MIQFMKKFTLLAVLICYQLNVLAAAPIQYVINEFIGNENKLRYNSDLTRNVFVKQIHSHNDYWRDVPLYTALSYGAQSVEADVWYFKGDKNLYVGHHETSLNSNRTLKSLYIDQLLKILKKTNPEYKINDINQINGVFDTDILATLYLFIDVKTESQQTWEMVENELKPLKENGYLTYFNGTDIIVGPITVVGTGNTPFQYISNLKTRHFFYDAPLFNLTTDYPNSLNPIASASLSQLIGEPVTNLPSTGLNKSQFNLIKSYIDKAHKNGIKTRIWDVSWWPIIKRNNLHRQLIELGTDFLNADDLEWASSFS